MFNNVDVSSSCYSKYYNSEYWMGSRKSKAFLQVSLLWKRRISVWSWNTVHALQYTQASKASFIASIISYFKGACFDILENEFSLNLQIWSLLRPIYHPWWKNCKFLSPPKVIIENNVLCYLLFYNTVETRFLISERVSPKLHSVCAWNFTHINNLLNMTQLLVPKSPYVWKKLGDEAVDQNKHLY